MSTVGTGGSLLATTTSIDIIITSSIIKIYTNYRIQSEKNFSFQCKLDLLSFTLGKYFWAVGPITWPITVAAEIEFFASLGVCTSLCRN